MSTTVRKTVIFLNKSVDRIVAIVSLILFLICLYAMIDAYMVFAGANDTGILRFKPDLSHPEALAELSADAVAWLSVDDTKIDYPVMQGENNEEYLNKDPYGNYSLSGSIFLDVRNKNDFTDDYSLVYGHHMEYGAMFGALDAFIDKAYFEAHRTGTLMVLNGKNYRIDFFASCKTQATEKTVFNPTDISNSELLEYLSVHSAVYYPEAVSAEQRIIGLSTCQSAESYERIIVFGTLTEIQGQESR